MINQLRKDTRFDYVIHTSDWHPENHVSFGKTHQKEPFTKITLENGTE